MMLTQPAFLLVVALATPPSPSKMVMAPLRGGDGTTEGMVKMVGEAVAAELRRKKTYHILTHGEVSAVLSHEQMRQLIGCDDADCYADIGGAAGARALVTGSLGKVGKSWLVTLKIIDVKSVRVVATADRRVRDGSVDDVLDQLPGMVGELIEGAKTRMTAKDKPAAVSAVSATSTKHEIPAAFKDVPLSDAGLLDKLTIVTNGKGHYIAFDAKERYSGPIFAGAAKGLYKQRVLGGGSAGETKWSATFWDSRARERWRAGLDVKEGVYALQCGDHKVTYKPVGGKKLARLKRKAKLFEVRWQRTAIWLARDDKGSYYFVDRALAPKGNTDYRLFVGTKGAVEYLPLKDAIVDPKSSIFISDRGRFIIRAKGREHEAAWAVGDSATALTVMNLWQQAPMVYTKLGAYRGQALGTVCDPYLGQ